MSSIHDRYLYLGFGIVLVVATRLIGHGLAYIADINTITDPSFGEEVSSPSPQDSLAPHTLITLASSPNANISRSAMLLLLDRLTSSAAESQSLVDDVFSPDPAARRRASQIDSLYQHPDYRHSVGNSPAAPWHGLLLMARGDSNAAARTVRAVYWHSRACQQKGDDGPMKLLLFLSKYLGDRFPRLRLRGRWSGLVICEDIEEKQISAWMHAVLALGRYTAHPKDTLVFFRNLAILEGCRWLEGEWMPHEAYQQVARAQEERRARARRFPVAVPAEEVPKASESLFADIDADRSNLPLSRLVQLRRPRFSEESAGHADARRRRREAMVLHEGEGSLQHDDIIQRR